MAGGVMENQESESAAIAASAAAVSADHPSPDEAGKVVTVQTSVEIISRQRLPSFVGISKATAGAKGISMNMVVIPPGEYAEPHSHRGYETAIYLLRGRIKTRYGAGLKQWVVSEAGDFIFIPADLPHQPVNLSDTHTAIAIVARNDPHEQENLVHYAPEIEKG